MTEKTSTVKKILVALALSLPVVLIPSHRLQATVSDTDTRTITALGNGVTTNYTIGFTFQDNDEVKVYREEQSATPYTRTLILQGSGASKFTITGGDPGTTVVMGTAPTVTQRLIILRNIPLTQQVDYVETDAFPAESHEAAMDKMTLLLQELDAKIDTKTGLSETSTSTAPTLPDPYADRFVLYNHAGTDLTLAPTEASSLVTGEVLKYSGTAWTLFDLDGALADLQAAISANIPALTHGNIFVGDVSNLADDVPLSGDATIADTGALSVVSVGGSTAANIATAEALANAATTLKTNNAIVRRNGSGAAALDVTGNLTGNADTATALAANPADCAAGNMATTIAANGTLTCAQVADSYVAAGAAITRSKLATGSNDHVLINNGSGVMTSEAQLDRTRGGTGISSTATFPSSGTVATIAGTQVLTNKDFDGGTASDASRITLPKASTATLSALTRKQGTVVYDTTRNKVLYDNGSTLTAVGTGSGTSANRASNAGFEDGTTDWTASGGTFTTTSTAANLGSELLSGSWDSSSASQTLTNTSVAITSGDGLSGQNGAASCRFKAATGTATHTIQAYDGTNVLGSATITSSTSGFVRTSVNFPFPASGSVSLRVVSVASNEPTIYIDDCYLGLAEGFNLSQVSQANFYGSLRYAATANCNWSTTTTTGAPFSLDSDCPTPTVTGSVTAPATKVPGLVIQGPGRFVVITQGARFNSTSGSDGSISWYLSDGTISSSASNATILTANDHTSSIPANASFSFEITDNSAHTFSIYIDTTDGAATTTLANAQTGLQNAGLNFHVYRFPLASEQVYRPDSAAWYVDANISGANISLGTGDQSSYVEMTDGSLTLTQNSGSIGVQIPCITGTASTGTTCSGVNESNGISFTLPKSGPTMVCASFSHSAQPGGTSGTVETTFQIVETSNTSSAIVNQGKSRVQSGTSLSNYTGSPRFHYPHRLCGIFETASVGQKTFRLMYEQLTGGTVTASQVLADAGATNGQRDVHWEAYPIAQLGSMPVLVGSVTSNSAGLERAERAIVTNAGTPTVSSQSGSWISSITDNGAGDSTINIAAGIFSSTPSCSCSAIADGTNSVTCHILSTTTPSATLMRVKTITSPTTASDRDFHIMCMGPR